MKSEAMKKIIFIVIGLFSILFTGCKKDLTTPFVGLVDKPEIYTNQTANNGLITLSWEAKNTKILLMQNRIVAVHDSITFSNMDTTFVFDAANDGETISKKVEINKIPLPEVLFNKIDTLSQSGTFNLVYSTKNSTKLIWNNVEYGPTGSLNLKVTVTTTFDFKILGPGGMLDTTVVIPVKEVRPLTQLEQILTSNPMVETFSRKSLISPNGPWQNANVNYSDPCMLDNIRTFLSTYKFIWSQGQLCAGGYVEPVTFNWTIAGDSLLMEGCHVYLQSYDFDKIIWIGKSSSSSWDEEKKIWVTVDMWLEVTNTFKKFK